jgi:two-component system response regulator AtoC
VATPTTLLKESTLAASQGGAAAGLHLLVMGPKQFATFALPARGEVIVGRGGGDGVGVKLDDAKASRRHLRLHIGDDVEVEDLGSANGTRVHGRRLEARARVRVLPGEAISVGSLVLMVQVSRSLPVQRRGRPLSEIELERRIDWECARADATGGTFSIARLSAPPDATPPDVAYGAIRMVDVVGRCGPRALALLMPGLAGETAHRVASAFAQRLADDPPSIRLASYPGDGRSAGALLARVRADDSDGAARRPIASVEASMLRVQALADRAAAGNINVLILGESGTGKEVLAQAIHAASARASRPLAPINCAALAPSLFESELFGHERGAFTGAAQAKPGLLETAPGGTVFLDEIGEMPMEAQAKLLRVIETREVLRVGGVRPRKIDVRFIFATNRDLEADVASGRFRRDLYFRLNGMTLSIPPLRERPADVPVFARGFLASAASEAPVRKPIPEISEAAMAVLCAHGWPGNVRELKQWIDRALLLCEGPTLLPEQFPEPHPMVASISAVPAPPPETSGDERARIIATLAACGGNQSRAARQLGISRKVLLARLDRYKLTRPRKPAAR